MAQWCGACLLAGCTTASTAANGGGGGMPDASAAGAVDGGNVDAGQGDAGTQEDAGMPISARRVRTLITLGSSSTAGAGASSVDTQYVSLLAQTLGARLVNLGTGGQTYDAVRTTYLPRALEALDAGPLAADQVDVVTFLPFTDFARSTPQQLVTGYAPVLRTLDRTHAWTVFGIPTIDPRYECGMAGDLRGPDGECYDSALLADYDAKATAMRVELALHPNATPLDIPQTQAQHPDWDAPDGHPNDLGHVFLAQLFIHGVLTRLGQDAGPVPVP